MLLLWSLSSETLILLIVVLTVYLKIIKVFFLNGMDIKTNTPIDHNLSGERIAHIVRLVTRDFYNSLETRLQPHGVNHGFWAYLRELWAGEGISQSELSQRVGLTSPTTNAVIKRMEASGLVELRPIVKGKPRCVVYLTERGKELRHVLEPLAQEVNDLAVVGMDNEQIEQIRTLLLHVHCNLIKDMADYN